MRTSARAAATPVDKSLRNVNRENPINIRPNYGRSKGNHDTGGHRGWLEITAERRGPNPLAAAPSRCFFALNRNSENSSAEVT